MLEFFVGLHGCLADPAGHVGRQFHGRRPRHRHGARRIPDRVSQLVLIDGLPANVRGTLTSPSIKRALETSAPSWLVSFGNWLFGGVMIESVLEEIVHDPALLTPAVIERSNRNRQRPGLITPS